MRSEEPSRLISIFSAQGVHFREIPCKVLKHLSDFLIYSLHCLSWKQRPRFKVKSAFGNSVPLQLDPLRVRRLATDIEETGVRRSATDIKRAGGYLAIDGTGGLRLAMDLGSVGHGGVRLILEAEEILDGQSSTCFLAAAAGDSMERCDILTWVSHSWYCWVSLKLLYLSGRFEFHKNFNVCQNLPNRFS